MIFQRFTLISIILLLPLLSSAANPDFNFTSDQDCSEKRLDLPPGVSSKVPIEDQDGTNLCAAYMSTQLIDAWRIANNSPVTDFTSPIAFGVQYASKTRKERLGDLSAIDMLENARNMNSCSYNVVRDDFNSKKSADFIYDLLQNFKKAKENSAQKEVAAKAILNCVLGSGTKKTFNLEQIKTYMDENNWVQFTNKIIENLCEGHSIPLNNLPPIETIKSSSYGNQFKAMNVMRDKVNERLNKANPQPMGISYCRSVLTDKEAEGVSTTGVLNKNTCKGEVHFSTIVGRRLLKYKDGDKTETICQYLVRDSFGSSCNGYPESEPEALPPKSGGEKPKVCEKGQVWVDENVLLRNTAELFHLKDK